MTLSNTSVSLVQYLYTRDVFLLYSQALSNMSRMSLQNYERERGEGSGGEGGGGRRRKEEGGREGGGRRREGGESDTCSI